MTRVRRVRCGVGPADFRWRAVGAWAVVGWVVLPLALTTGSEERLSFTLPLSVSASEVSVWAALAVTLVERGVRFAVPRGRVSPATGLGPMSSSLR